jgi:hypothetical protein
MSKTYALNGVVINPRFAGIRFRGSYLKDGIIYGFTMDSNMSAIQYDVMNGIIEDYDFYTLQEEDKKVRNYLESVDTYVSREAMEQALEDWWVKEQGHESLDLQNMKALDSQRYELYFQGKNAEALKARARRSAAGGEIAALSTSEKRFVVALANHQVSGDEIIKGLKANGFNLSVKLQESYLGGWNADGLSLVELLESIEQRSE